MPLPTNLRTPWPSAIAAWRKMAGPWRRRLAVAGGALLLAAVFGPALAGHLRNTFTPFVANDDARQQIYPFYAYEGAEQFRSDYAARYYLGNFSPGYRALYVVAAKTIGVVPLSRLLPYLLLLVTAGGVYCASNRINGPLLAFASVAFCLSSPHFLARMAGGLPRGFAFPMLAVAAVALTRERFVLAGAVTIAAAAFYPPSAVVCGLSLAIVLLTSREAEGPGSWPMRQKLAFLAGVALVTVALTVPPVMSGRDYGSRLTPADASAYPESAEGGRYGREDGPPFAPLPDAFAEAVGRTISGRGELWAPQFRAWLFQVGSFRGHPLVVWLVGLMLIAGVVARVVADRPTRRLIGLGVAAAACYVGAVLFVPVLFLPERYANYPLPLLTAILLPTAFSELASRLGVRRLNGQRAISAVLCIAVLGMLGGRGDSAAGLRDYRPYGKTLLFLAGTPPEARIAGWPRGLVETVPLFARRQVLVQEETHQAFHRGYADEMRNRMSALVGAYYAQTPTPLLALRVDHGVRFLVVDERHFLGRPPTYFAPFRTPIQTIQRRRSPADLEVLRQRKCATVFRDGPFFVLDLERVQGSPCA